jgi:hypothetical protein
MQVDVFVRGRTRIMPAGVFRDVAERALNKNENALWRLARLSFTANPNANATSITWTFYGDIAMDMKLLKHYCTSAVQEFFNRYNSGRSTFGLASIIGARSGGEHSVKMLTFDEAAGEVEQMYQRVKVVYVHTLFNHTMSQLSMFDFMVGCNE